MTAITHSTRPVSHPFNVRHVPAWKPFAWLARGAADVAACAPANLAHGLLMVALGWVLFLMLGRSPFYMAVAVSAFLLMAPIMTTGICELSRLRASGQRLDVDASLAVLNREGRDLFRFGAVLAVVALSWFALSETTLAHVLHVPGQSLVDTYYHGFVDTASSAQLGSYLAIGIALALIVFALSVVTVPFMIERRAPATEAMRASLAVAGRNPLAMIVWAGLLVLLTIVGFATWLLGMIVLIPLLGHATWHAYRDLLADDGTGYAHSA